MVIATFNEERNIKACLDSVKDLADEVVVVDGHSQDETVHQVKKFVKLERERKSKLKVKLIQTSNKMMFHRNKQLGLEKAAGDWILQLDADERVASALSAEISSKVHQVQQVNGFFIPRKNYFLGRFLKKGGQYPDDVIRLIKKGKAHFPCQSVHEQIRVDGQVDYLKNDLIHLTAPTLSDYLRNANRYTTLTAWRMKKEGQDLHFFSQLKYLFWLPLKTFFKLYFRHKGFQDGFPGFIFALFSGLHYSIAFIKYWEKEKTGGDFNLAKDWQSK